MTTRPTVRDRRIEAGRPLPPPEMAMFSTRPAFCSASWRARAATALVFALAALVAAWAIHALARHPGASFLTAPVVLLLAAAHAAVAAALAHSLLMRVAWPWAALWGMGVAVFSALATAVVLSLSITEVSASPWAKASAAALFVVVRLVADPRLSGPILLAGAGAALVACAFARRHSREVTSRLPPG